MIQVGQALVYQRTFTAEDIALFARVSGDTGSHHVAPDALGRVMVHGLLTATLPTKIGGDLNYIAREMHFYFERPVFAGDTVTCVLTATEVAQEGTTIHLSAEWMCRNQNDKIVLTGSTRGIVRE